MQETALVVVSYVHFLQAVGHSETGTHVHGKRTELSERNSASRTGTSLFHSNKYRTRSNNINI